MLKLFVFVVVFAFLDLEHKKGKQLDIIFCFFILINIFFSTKKYHRSLYIARVFNFKL